MLRREGKWVWNEGGGKTQKDPEWLTPETEPTSCQDGAESYAPNDHSGYKSNIFKMWGRKGTTGHKSKINMFMAQKRTKTQWQATGYRAGSWQRWPGVPFLGVHRLKAAGLNLRLGSGPPTCERGEGKPQTMPWARFVHSCILAWEVSLPSSPREEKLGHEESVSRLEYLGRQVEPRREPTGEAGKTEREGRGTKNSHPEWIYKWKF